MTTNPPQFDLHAILAKAKRQWSLLVVLVVAFVVVATLAMAIAEPTYQVTAVIGPPGQRLDATELSGASSAAASLASRLGLKRSLGSGSDNTYDKYISILQSNRLAAGLMHDTSVMQIVFYKSWDADARQWRAPGGPLADAKAMVKGLLHLPVKSRPDSDDLAKFLNTQLTVDAPLNSPFATVSTSFKSPAEAQAILTAILSEADNLIRDERRRDVEARIAYLERILPKVDAADQRTSLTAVLSEQQQSMMEIEADKRYAYSLIDPPHANVVPTKPNPKTNYVLAIFLALVCWAGIVVFLPAEAAHPRNWMKLLAARR